MIATAHQPHFLPWLGYVNKALNCDVFIWLDTVQFRKNYFQNRTRIIGTSGEEEWLTLPVHAPFESAIREVVVAGGRWRSKVIRTIEQAYGRAPYFARYWPALQAGLEQPGDALSELNLRLFEIVLQALGRRAARIVRAIDLDVDASDPTVRLVELCRAVGADTYLSGRGGRKYLDVAAFEKAGIEVVWQAFDSARAAYTRQDGRTASNLSVIDCLFHVGDEAVEIARRAWSP